MNGQDSKFNLKAILAALCIVLIAVIIAFYFSNAQSKSKINFLKHEKVLLIKDITIMKADIDRLSALNEVNDIELQSSKYKVQQLLDSIGRFNFSATKLQEYKSELLKYEYKIDSFKLKNTFLKYNNISLKNKYKEAKNELENLKGNGSSLVDADAIKRKKMEELNNELKMKSYLEINNLNVDGYRLRGNKYILTNKASAIEKLQGCVTIVADSSLINEAKVIYFQFLNPSKDLIKGSFNTITASDAVYSKRVEFALDGTTEMQVCDFIPIPEGSLTKGIYTLNVFEDGRVLSATKFVLK